MMMMGTASQATCSSQCIAHRMASWTTPETANVAHVAAACRHMGTRGRAAPGLGVCLTSRPSHTTSYTTMRSKDAVVMFQRRPHQSDSELLCMHEQSRRHSRRSTHRWQLSVRHVQQ